MNQQSTIINNESATRTAQRQPPSGLRSTEAGRHRVWGGLAMALLVAIGTVASFLPRPSPHFPATSVQPQRMLINSAAQVDAQIVAAGELGHLFFSVDAGKSWQDAKVEPQRGSTLTRVFFPSPTLGFAVGHDNWILRTEDGGKTWQEANFAGENSEVLLDVWGKAQGPLFAIGSFGSFLTSTDKGKSWAPRDTALGDRHLYALSGAGETHLMLVGESGLVARSSDQGTTWTRLPEFYKGSFFGLVSLSPDTWLVYGMRGKVYRTQDFGETWKEIDSGTTAALYGGTQTREGNVVLVGEGGVVTVSEDHGQTFKRTHAGGGQSLSSVSEATDARLIFVGPAGITQQAQQPVQRKAVE
ncbi:WD40/YVTN/BNR-like repeat-containing protein [Pseudomonas sp. LB3P38]|uniref:WD40/YVTN/BNR-like repeat-containing protein n=1 Tax=Pseudomonas lyxosi TaxID=3398358 RepID=UPI0039EFCB65